MATRLMRFISIFLAFGWASNANAQIVTYQNNPNGQVSSATYSNGTTVQYLYDASGNRLSAVVTADTTPPSAPGVPAATAITGSTATVSWSAATDNFKVACYSYQLNGGAWSACTNVLSVNLTGLINGTTYTVGVRAQDAAGNFGAISTHPFTTPDTAPPSAPGTPTASAITATTATVTWTAATDNVGVTGYSYQLNGGAWSAFAAPLNVHLTGLTNGTSYNVGVRAHDAAGNIGATASHAFSTLDTTAPSAPGTPTASNITGTTATVTWTAATDNVGVTGYSYQLNGGTWSAYTTPLSVNLTGLTNGTAYTVGVRAHDAAGNVGATKTGSFTSTADTTAPSAPGVPAASSITGTTVTISWTAATDNVGVTGYSYQLNGGAWSAFTSPLSVNVTGLTNATHYTVGVRAHDAAGNIGATASGAFTTLDTAPPSAPGAPTASSITATSATVAWTAATDNVGVTGYSYQLNGGAWSAFSAPLSVALTGLTNGTGYTVGVRAHDAVGNVGATATGSFTTLDNAAPTAPGTPTASSITGTSATVSWAAATDNVGVTGYSYQVNGGAWSAFSSALSVNLTGLAGSTGYSVGVRAHDAAGNIGPTATGSFTTADTIAPSAPGTPTASSITGTTATISWPAASDNVGVTAYSYQLNGGAWSTFTNVLSVNLTGLANATAYTVGVRAEDAASNIGPTATGSFTTLDTTPPSAPGTASASNIGPTSATVSWTAATDNVGVTGYRYSTNGGASWTNVGNALSTNLTGLALGTAYTVLVQAQDAAGNWGASSSGSFTTSSVYTDNLASVGGTLNGGTYEYEGYEQGAFGSLTPNTTSNGKTITVFMTYIDFYAGTYYSELVVTGFSADPGVDWLQSIFVSGGTPIPGIGATYYYSNGGAEWVWPSTAVAAYTTATTLTIVHK